MFYCKLGCLMQIAESFRSLCKEYGYSPHMILPHGSYLGNLGSGDREQREKSLELLVDEIDRYRKQIIFASAGSFGPVF